MKPSNESKRSFNIDYVLIGFVVISGLIGMISIYMSAPISNLVDVKSDLVRQSIWFMISFTFVIFLLKFGTDRLFTGAYLFYWILMGLLAVQLLARFGIIRTSLIPEIKGIYGWYVIPKIGSFQPSEFMKMILLFITANIIYEHNLNKEDNSFASDIQLLLKMARYALPPLVMIVLQPDTGIPIIIVVSLAAMFFLSGVRKEWILVIGSIAAVLFFGIIYLYYNHESLLSALFGGGDYRLNRFYGWLDYVEYSSNWGLHLYNAIASLGTAGWFGHEWMSVILTIPEANTDFIFAVIAQNFGFIGASITVLICFSMDIHLALIALRSDLTRERALLTGAVAMLVFQHTQNIGMVLGVLPITGITLPFFSYGGSSILSYMLPLSVAMYMYSETKNLHKHY